MGDVIHQMPALTDARANLPDAHIAWVVEEAFAPLARLHPGVNEIIPVATRRWRKELLSPATWREIADFKTRLRTRRYDKVIDTQGLIRTGLMAHYALGEKHGYDAQSIREPLASRFYDVTHSVSRDLHAVTRNRMLTAASLNCQPSDGIDYGLPLAPRTSDAKPYALLFHGTSRVTKEWRESDWIGTGQALVRMGLDVILTWGNERERLRCGRLAGGIKGARVLDRQPLDAMAKLIAGAQLAIGVDTGLLHLAAAYRVPLIGIYLSTEPGLTGPMGAGAINILGGRGQYPAYAQVVQAAETMLHTA